MYVKEVVYHDNDVLINHSYKKGGNYVDHKVK